MQTLKGTFQVCLIGALPFTSQLPCGVFMYWITSGVWGLAQNKVLRDKDVLAAMGVEVPPPPGAKAAGTAAGAVGAVGAVGTGADREDGRRGGEGGGGGARGGDGGGEGKGGGAS